MADIVEYILISDFKSPNTATKDNQVVFKTFSKGSRVAGYPLNQQNSNIGTQLTKDSIIVVNGNWLIPFSKLQKSGTKSWNSFEEYNKDTSKIKSEDLPEEIRQKIAEIANKNLALKATAAVKSNVKLAMAGLGIGLAYAFIAKKNVYMYGIGGMLAGIVLTVFQNQKESKKDN